MYGHISNIHVISNSANNKDTFVNVVTDFKGLGQLILFMQKQLACVKIVYTPLTFKKNSPSEIMPVCTAAMLQI